MTLFTSLPRHLYCAVERKFVEPPRLGPSDDVAETIPCVWFGLTSVPGRAWGLTVLLESGAIYSHLPPNAIVFGKSDLIWNVEDSQQWDCFGVEFALHEYDYLAGRMVEVLPERYHGRYLFTAQHYGDGYSRTPEQAKQYHFIRLMSGRLACLPANRLLVHAAEFTNVGEIPRLRRQTEEYFVE